MANRFRTTIYLTYFFFQRILSGGDCWKHRSISYLIIPDSLLLIFRYIFPSLPQIHTSIRPSKVYARVEMQEWTDLIVFLLRNEILNLPVHGMVKVFYLLSVTTIFYFKGRDLIMNYLITFKLNGAATNVHWCYKLWLDAWCINYFCWS